MSASRARSSAAPSGAGSGRSRSTSETASTASAASPIGSRRTSGAPVSTWLPAETCSSLTVAAKGAGMTVSIFIDSRTRTG